MKCLFLIFPVLFLFGVSSASESLSVLLADRAVYSEANGETEITINHYLLSDSSLHFIQFLWGDEDYTLPRIVSASGVRYSMEMDITWWEAGETAMLQTRDSLGNWQTEFEFTLLLSESL